MRRLHFVIALTVLFSSAGCLKFGTDEETTSPTQAQVDRCRSEMYLHPALKIVPLGYKLWGSGIDDSIWFKFKTDTKEMRDMFDATVVDTSKFADGFTFFHETDGPKWWDVKGKKLLGGKAELPNVKVMAVGIEKTEEGSVVYIMWWES